MILENDVAHHVEHDQREVHGDEVQRRDHQPLGNARHEFHLQDALAARQQKKEGTQAEVGQPDDAHHAHRGKRVESGPEALRDREDHDARRHREDEEDHHQADRDVAEKPGQTDGEAGNEEDRELLVRQIGPLLRVVELMLFGCEQTQRSLVERLVRIADEGKPDTEVDDQVIERRRQRQDEAEQGRQGQHRHVEQRLDVQRIAEEVRHALPERRNGRHFGGRRDSLHVALPRFYCAADSSDGAPGRLASSRRTAAFGLTGCHLRRPGNFC